MKIKLAGVLAFTGLLPACLAALLASPARAIPPPPIPAAPVGAGTYSSEQLSATPSVELAQQLFSDWARGLVEKRPEEGPAFYTRPKAGYAGVCEVTRVRFGMATPTVRSGDGKSYVQGVGVEQLYHLVALPGPFDPTHVAQANATIALCEGLGTGVKYFPAPSALVVAYQHHLIEDAVVKAKGNGSLDFKLDCLRGAGSDCSARSVLAKLDASEIKSIKARDCAGYSRDECYEISVGDWVLETESRLSTYGYSLVEPDRILVSIGVSKLPHYLVVDCSDCR